MTPLEMIAEWRKGCSCAAPGKPEECQECTVALINALERSIPGATKDAVDVSLRLTANALEKGYVGDVARQKLDDGQKAWNSAIEYCIYEVRQMSNKIVAHSK